MLGRRTGWFGLALGCVLAAGTGQAQDPEMGLPWDEPLRSVTFEFALGDRLHQGRITRAQELAPVQDAWKVVQRWPEAPASDRPRLLGRLPAVLIAWGDSSPEVFHLAGRNQLHSERWGRLILAPEVFRAIERWASDQEGAPVRLGVENPFPAERIPALRRFQGLADQVWVRARMEGPHGPVEWHGSPALDPLRASFHGLYIPRAKSLGKPWGHELVLSPLRQAEQTLRLLDGGQEPTRPLHAVLLHHERWGPVWVADEFREAWLDGYRVANPLDPVPEERQTQERAAAQRALQLLAQSTPQPVLHRTTDWDLERQIWVPVVRAVPTSLGGAPWTALWKSASLQPLSNVAEAASRWQDWQATAPMLLWRDPAGRAWTLFEGANQELWMGPAWRVDLSQDPWEQILSLGSLNETAGTLK